MFEVRVTKYDPKFRSIEGAYMRSDWTSVSDVGRAFNGVVLTREQYDRSESAYIFAAKAFLEETGASLVRIAGLEDPDARHSHYCEGAAIPVAEVGPVLALLLREELWCRLESPDAFIHVGNDFYMYVGTSKPCPFSQRRAVSSGLFVEPFRSPYHDESAA